MSGLEIVLVLFFVALGGLVQGCIGIGVGLVAGPALVSINPAFAPGPLLLVGAIIGIRHMIVERAHIDRTALRHVLFGIPFGLVAGLSLLLMIDARTLSILVGAGTAIAATAILLGFSVPQSGRAEVAAGSLMAFASVTAALPGPPLVVAFSDMSPSAMRGTASGAVFSMIVVAAVSLVAAGRFGAEELRLLALLVPGVLVGMGAARYLRPVLDRSWFRTAVLLMALAGGVALVIRQMV